MKHDDTYRNVELDVHASVPSLAWQFAQHAGDAIAVIEQGIFYLAHGDAPPAKWPVVTRNAWPVTLALFTHAACRARRADGGLLTRHEACNHHAVASSCPGR